MERLNLRPVRACAWLLLFLTSPVLLTSRADAVSPGSDPRATPPIPVEQATPTPTSAAAPASSLPTQAALFQSAWIGELRTEAPASDKAPEVRKLDFTFHESGLLIANDRKSGQGELFGNWSFSPDGSLIFQTRDRMTYTGKFDPPGSISGSAVRPPGYYAPTLQTLPRYSFSLIPSKAKRLIASPDVTQALSVEPGKTVCGKGKLTGRAVRNTLGTDAFQATLLPPAQGFTFKTKRMTQHGQSMANVRHVTSVDYIDVEFCLTAPGVLPSPHTDAVLVRFDFGNKNFASPEISASSTYLKIPIRLLPE